MPPPRASIRPTIRCRIFAAAASPDQLAEAELKLTASMLDYARQAQSGRMHWSQVAADILYPEHPTDPAEVLANISTAKDASAALDSYNPPHKLYKELKPIAELRGQGDGPMIHIAEGPALAFKAATKSRVKSRRKIRACRNCAPSSASPRSRRHALRRQGRRCRAQIPGERRSEADRRARRPHGEGDQQPEARPADRPVLVNMERLRWLPRQLGAASLGNAYVILNVPDFTLKVMQNGAPVWTTRVVTGKPGKHATPMLTETMKFITVNPTWNVPPSIIYNEYLPALQQDPTVLQRMGLRLERNRDGSIHISQPPARPTRSAASASTSRTSSWSISRHPGQASVRQGRARLQPRLHAGAEPDQYASTLLNIVMPNERYSPEKIRSMYGRSEIDLEFPTPIPVNITYQTAFVDDAGKLQIRKDIYGRDAVMLGLLKNSRNKDLEVMVSRPAELCAAEDGLPAGVNFASDNTYSSGPSFFERLFGAHRGDAARPGRPPAATAWFTR